MGDISSLVSSAASSAKNKLLTAATSASGDLTKQLTDKLSSLTANPALKMSQRMTDQLRKTGNVAGAVQQLEDKLKSLTSGQKQNLLSSKLAQTIFAAGPLDELITVDTLGISDTSIINSLAGKLTDFSTDALEAFRSSTGIAEDLSNMISSATSGLSLDPAALASRVVDSLGGNSSVLSGLTESLTSSLSSTLQFGGGGVPTLSGAAEALVASAGIDPGIYTQVVGIVNGVAHEFDSNNPQTSQAVFDLIGNFTGDSELAKIVDVGAEANILSTAFSEMISIGLPEVIPVLCEQAQTQEAVGYALRANLPRALAKSDLVTTELIIEKLGIERAVADVPNAAQRLLHNYQFPKGTSSDQYAACYTALKATMDKFEPGWGTVNRNGEDISDLTIFATASKDARKLLAAQEDFAVAALIAGDFQEQHLVNQVRGMYPRARI